MKLLGAFIKRHLWKSIFGISGTLILILIVIIVVMIMGAFYTLNNNSTQFDSSMQSCGQLTDSVPEKVLSYQPIVQKELKKYGVSTDLTTCFIAQMMQESGGNPPDVFQSSESKYGVIGAIKTVDESVEQGVLRWVQINEDLKKLRLPFNVELVWQTYNFGTGFADWLADTKQTYSSDAAFQYSEKMYNEVKSTGNYRCHFQEQKGEACYGDFMYPQHIERYLKTNKENKSGGKLQVPFVNIPYVVTSEYGPRDGGFHEGIDLVAYFGAPVSAADDGIVVSSLPTNSSGGYGEMVTIKHSNGLFTRYGHMSKRFVHVNQKVKKGELIGLQGNTGDSTGTHLHFEVRSANDYDNSHTMNPRDYVTINK